MCAAPGEGVIRFDVRHEQRPLEERVLGATARVLSAWRELLAGIGVIGRDPGRYEGLGYGNVSARVGPFGDVARGRRRFLVSGSQTGGLAHLTLREYALVESWDLEENRVSSAGLVAPSSESLTHAALYDVSPAIRVVLHAHAPDLWRHARALGLPVSRPEAANGTTAMALEVQRLYREGTFASTRVAALASARVAASALAQMPLAGQTRFAARPARVQPQRA